MLGNIGLFKGIMAKMSWLDQNQEILSKNVANSDTPGYRPQSLKTVDFSDYLGAASKKGITGVKMAATESAHFGATGQNYNGTTETRQKKIYEASPDDNGVVIEEQLFRANKNSTEYQIASDLYRRNAGMIRMVLQGARG
jgi:flagellar basal-body rod protein FlgB